MPDPEVLMLHMLEALRRRLTDQEGQTMAEYGVVLTVITIGCVGAMTLLGGNAANAFERVAAILGLAT